MARVLLLSQPLEAEALSFLLEDEGHEPAFLPVLPSLETPHAGLRAAAEQLGRFTWAIVTDRPALRLLLESAQHARTRLTVARTQWLVADAASALAVERQGGVARVPADLKWTHALSGLLSSDDEVLVLSVGAAPEAVLEALDSVGARATVLELSAVETVATRPLPSPVDLVVVHSPAEADEFVWLTRGETHAVSDACCSTPHHIDAPRWVEGARARLVASTAATADVLRAAGLEVFAVAQSTAADGVADVALRALAGSDNPV